MMSIFSDANFTNAPDIQQAQQCLESIKSTEKV
jgi:hypothetical protein